MITNPDIEYVQGIIKGIVKKSGHCPCKVEVSDDTICPCKDFRETGHCCCKLYIEEDTNENIS